MENDQIWKGLLAGALAGIAATAAKTLWESKFPVRSESTETPPLILANQIKTSIVNKPVQEENESIVENSIHWTFGTGTGAAYGVAAESLPMISSGLGLPFGIAFWLGTHGSIVPLANLEPFPTEVQMNYAVNEFAGHLVYGVVLELTRRAVRITLD